MIHRTESRKGKAARWGLFVVDSRIGVRLVERLAESRIGERKEGRGKEGTRLGESCDETAIHVRREFQICSTFYFLSSTLYFLAAAAKKCRDRQGIAVELVD